jgi:hypothetical protein
MKEGCLNVGPQDSQYQAFMSFDAPSKAVNKMKNQAAKSQVVFIAREGPL